jgi:hypothetical protein
MLILRGLVSSFIRLVQISSMQIIYFSYCEIFKGRSKAWQFIVHVLGDFLQVTTHNLKAAINIV